MKIQWQADEYEYKKKSPDWFWALWIISIAVIFISIMFNSTLFAILVFVGAFTLSLQAVRKPSLITYKIDELGITVGDKTHIYKNIKSYDIKEGEELEIIFKLESKFMPFVTIHLTEEVDIQKIEGFLVGRIEKEGIEKPIVDKLAKYL